MTLRAGALGFFALAFVAVGTQAASAEGFLDALGAALFGHRPATAPGVQVPYGGEPLRMRVRPLRQQVGHRSLRKSRKSRVAAAPKAPLVKIDPDADPTWYLADATLRRGDIIVTKGGVVVFEGAAGREHGPDEFAALSETRLVPPSERRMLTYAVAGWMPSAPVTAKPEIVKHRHGGRRTRRTASRR